MSNLKKIAVVIGFCSLSFLLMGAGNSAQTFWSFVKNSWTQADSKYIGTDELRARDSGGLKLYEDSGANGILVNDNGSITLSTDLALTEGGTGASTASAARSNLGLAIGTDVQAFDAQLTDVSGLAVTDGGFIVGDGSNFILETGATARASLGLGTVSTMPNTNISIFGGTITGITDLAVADGGTGASTAGDARTNLGLVIGTDVQAFDADLSALAGLSNADSNFIVGNGSTWIVESGATVRTSLGLGSMALQADTSVDINGGTIDGTTIGQSATAVAKFSAVTVTGDLTVLGSVTATLKESWSIKTGNYQMVAYDRIYTDSASASFFVTLPASPVIKDVVEIWEGTDSAGTNSVQIDPNGSDKIEGGSTSVVLDTNGMVLRFTYMNATEGWKLSVN